MEEKKYERVEFNGSKTFSVIDKNGKCVYVSMSERKCIEFLKKLIATK